MRLATCAPLALAAALAALPAAAAEPSAYALATHASMRGALSEHVGQTVRSAVHFAAAEDWPSIESMSREQLKAEADRLAAESPSIGGGIAMTCIGGGLLFAGFITTYVGLLGILVGTYAYVGVGFIVAAVIGVGLLIGGGVLLGVGIVRLVGSIRERRAYSTRIDEVNRRIEQLDSGSPYAPPPPPAGAPPPPPPPPPPSAMGNTPAPSMLLAEF